LQSGLAAGECAIAALINGGPDDFTNYAQRMEAAWGREYRRGRYFHKLVGIPAIASAGLKVLDKVNHPGFRAHFLFWEGWRDPKQAVRREQEAQRSPADS
jgi:menaquinone-9 beta-reductase